MPLWKTVLPTASSARVSDSEAKGAISGLCQLLTTDLNPKQFLSIDMQMNSVQCGGQPSSPQKTQCCFHFHVRFYVPLTHINVYTSLTSLNYL